MGIRRFCTEQLVVRKLKSLGGYKKGFRSTATVEGHIQKMDDEETMAISGVLGQTFIGWLPEDINFTPEPNDQITDPDGRIFVVETAEKLDFGTNQHWEMIMKRWNPKDRE